MSESTKGKLQSLTIWGIVVAGAGLLLEHSGQIESLCMQFAPSPWSAGCGPVVAILVQIAGLLMAWKGRTRKGDLKGLWKK